MLICYDVEFPELSRLMADQGMQILFVPFLTDTQNAYSRVRVCAQARAIENECFVVIAGCVGNLPRVHNMDIQYAQSGVFTPCDFAFPTDGKRAEATPNTEMILVSDVDLDFESEVRLPEREQKILDLLSAEPEQCVTKLEKDSGLKNILSVIKSLLDKEAIFVKEELRRTYKPKTETRVRLADEVRNEKRLQELFDELARAPKQLDLLMKYIELSGIWGGDGLKSFPKEVNSP